MVGLSVSQTSLGSEMGTASNGGTAWYNGRYPVENAMDGHTAVKGLHYDSVAVSFTATSTDKANFTTRLVNDVDYSAPLIGDAYEVPGGPHLVGHPANSTIYHWFAVRGYASSGATTAYQDSVHGASSISWSGGVPAYSSLSSNTVTSIVGGRGYVW